MEFIIGDRVFVGNKPGVIAYLGEVKFAAGDFAGVVLDVPVGKNDGSVKGTRYFQCEPLKGVFVKASKLVPNDSPSTPLSLKPSPRHNHSLSSHNAPKSPARHRSTTSSPSPATTTASTTSKTPTTSPASAQTGSEDNRSPKSRIHSGSEAPEILVSDESNRAKTTEQIEKIQREYENLLSATHTKFEELQQNIDRLEKENAELHRNVEEQKHKVEDLQFQLEEEVLSKEDIMQELVDEKNNNKAVVDLPPAQIIPEVNVWEEPPNAELKIAELEKQLEETLKENTSLKDEIEQVKSQLSDIEFQLAENETEKEANIKEKKKSEEDISVSISETYDSVSTATNNTSANQSLALLSCQLAEKTRLLEILQESYSNVDQNQIHLQEKINHLESQNSQCIDINNRLQEQRKLDTNVIQQLRNQLANCMEAIEKLENQLQQTNEENTQLQIKDHDDSNVNNHKEIELNHVTTIEELKADLRKVEDANQKLIEQKNKLTKQHNLDIDAINQLETQQMHNLETISQLETQNIQHTTVIGQLQEEHERHVGQYNQLDAQGTRHEKIVESMHRKYQQEIVKQLELHKQEIAKQRDKHNRAMETERDRHNADIEDLRSQQREIISTLQKQNDEEVNRVREEVTKELQDESRRTNQMNRVHQMQQIQDLRHQVNLLQMQSSRTLVCRECDTYILELDKMQTALEQMQKSNEKTVKQMSNKIDCLNQDKHQLTTVLTSRSDMIEALKQQVLQTQSKLESWQEDVREQVNCNKLKSQNDLESLRSELGASQSLLTQLEKKLCLSQTENQRLQNRVTILQHELDRTSHALLSPGTNLDNSNGTYRDTSGFLFNQLTHQVEVMELNLLKAAEDDLRLKAENEELKLELCQLKYELNGAKAISPKRNSKPRIFCDICQLFDLHVTSECTNRQSNLYTPPSRSRLLPQCTICQSQVHTAADCTIDE